MPCVTRGCVFLIGDPNKRRNPATLQPPASAFTNEHRPPTSTLLSSGTKYDETRIYFYCVAPRCGLRISGGQWYGF